jgi:localization factor PodJL
LADVLVALDRHRSPGAGQARALDAAESEFLSRQFAELKQTDRKTQDSLDALQRTLGHLLDRLSGIETDIRNQPALPSEVTATASSGPATAKAASDSVSVSAISGPAELATPQVQSAAPVSSQQRAIDPNLPPDLPLEPGLAGLRSRNPASPADRIAASESLLAGTKPPFVPNSDSKANFIAAARRAAQAAERASAAKNEVAGPSEIATAAGRLAKRMSKLRAVIAATSSIVLVLISIQVARLLPGISEQTEIPAEAPAAAPAAAREENSPGGSATLSANMPSSFPPALVGAGRGVEARAATDPAADDPPRPGEVHPTTLPPGRPITTETAQPAAPEPSVSTAANSEITGSTAAPAKPPAAASASRIASTPAASQAAIAAEQLPGSFGSALRAAAARGDPAAQYEIAQRYADGRGVPQNLTEAANWFERAAGQGLAPAQFRLGGLHEKGLGVRKNVELARRYYSAAGAAGNAKALHNLAVLHAEGVDGKPDYPTAARWFRKAAEYGITDSQYNLAVLYARGIGVEQNMSEAYRWFALAARDGDAEAAKKRDEIAARLDPRSLAAATQAVDSWKPEPQPEKAVNVRAPSEGWDAPASAPPPAPPAASGKRKPRGAATGLDLAPASTAQ